MAREHAMNPDAGHGPHAVVPRLLLVEDDPASRLFLAGALEAMPAVVIVAGTVAEARQCIDTGGAFDLLLFDANLPDGTGAGLLREVRALGDATPALAHTAGTDRDALDALLAAGFAEVLVKPLPAALLQATVRRLLGIAGSMRVSEPMHCGKLPVWDDEAAASALGGNPAHVAVLRALFLAELPQQRDAVLDAFARGDASAVAAGLHRLQASCGFVGATRLGDAVDLLRHRMDSGEARDRFAHAAQDLLDSAG